MKTKTKKTVKKLSKKVGVKPLSASEIKKVLALHAKGKSQRFIGNAIGRSRSAVFYQIQKSRNA